MVKDRVRQPTQFRDEALEKVCTRRQQLSRFRSRTQTVSIKTAQRQFLSGPFPNAKASESFVIGPWLATGESSSCFEWSKTQRSAGFRLRGCFFTASSREFATAKPQRAVDLLTDEVIYHPPAPASLAARWWLNSIFLVFTWLSTQTPTDVFPFACVMYPIVQTLWPHEYKMPICLAEAESDLDNCVTNHEVLVAQTEWKKSDVAVTRSRGRRNA